ncbi:MAG: hypothetical protein AAF546_10230, partial [Verrucomicrobiota bacterium]
MYLRFFHLLSIIPFCGAHVLFAQPCETDGWAELTPGSGITCISQTGSATFGGIFEFEDTNGPIALRIYATLRGSGYRQTTDRSTSCRSSYEEVSIFGSISFDNNAGEFIDTLGFSGYKDLGAFSQGCGEGIIFISGATGVSGETVSSTLRVDSESNTMYPADEFKPSSEADLDNKEITFSLSGSPFSAALATAGSTTGSSCTTVVSDINNVSKYNSSDLYDNGDQVTGTFTGTTVDFTAKLKLGGCGSDYELVENYSSSLYGSLPPVRKTLSNIEPNEEGNYLYRGSVPMGDTGESITLESIAYREIPTCDGPKSDLGSVDWRYPLNFYIDGNEHATGLLSLQVDAITDAYDFTQIQFAAGSDEAIIVLTDTNQNIEQILTAYHLINIASVDLGGSTDADGFTLTIYAREDVDLDSDLSGSGTFGLNSGAVFAEQYLFEDPDRGAPSGTLRTLIVSRFTEGSSTVTSSSTYTHDSATDEWTLAISGEHEILSLQESVSGSIRTETRTWRDLSSNVIRIEETDYKMITDAGAEIELMVEERNWADYASGTGVPIASSLKSTVWNYYETGTSFGLLESVVYPDGRWMRYTYDSEDRVATMVAGYLSNDSSTSDSVNRLTRYERFDGVMLDSETGDLKIETRLLAGQIVAQTMEFRIEEVDTDTGYLLEKTITRRYLTAVAETTVGWSSGVYEESTDWEFAGGPWEYLPRRALNTDSIETYYNYTEVFNFEKQEFAVLNERWRGVYDSVNSEFIEGTYVKEESDLSDNLIYRLSTDIESGQLIDSVVYVEFDEEGRGTSAVYLDG